MKSTKLLKLLFGKSTDWSDIKSIHRSSVWTFPAKDEDEESISITYAGDDGFLYYLLKRIIKLEKETDKLKFNKKK